MKTKFKKLREKNQEMRDSLDGYLPIDTAENKRCWELINEIIENEIELEGFCNG